MSPSLPTTRRTSPLCLLCVLALSALPQPSCHAQADIIPGSRADVVRLGMSAAQVRSSGAAPPDAVFRGAGGVTEMNWDGGPFVLLRGGRVFQVEVSDENESTPEGAHGGDTLAQVRARYAPLRHTAYTGRDASRRAEPVDIYDDVGRGVAFEFSPDDGAGSRVDLESIFVHVPGRPVMPEADLRPRKG